VLTLISPGTYEKLGSELIDAGNSLNNNIGKEHMELNNPDFKLVEFD
jgi:hypothetical protein